MIIDKTFEVLVNLVDIADIFSNNLDLIILNKIKALYEKKCFKSSYILEITNIIERGMLSINKRSLSCETSVDVKFTAKVIIFEYLEIINNNVIENITKSRIECRTESTASYINISNQDMSVLAAGQIIPIRVGKATYQPMQSTISINAFPFIPIAADDIYYKIDVLTKEERELLNSTIMVDINDIHEQLKSTSKDRTKFFKALLYPYKTPYKAVPNLKDILTLDTHGIVCLSSKLDMFNHQMINMTDYENPVVESSLTIYKIYLNTYLKHIKTILEMAITYKDDDVFEANQNVFEIYEKYKLNK